MLSLNSYSAARWGDTDLKIRAAARPASSRKPRIGTNINIHRIRGTATESPVDLDIRLTNYMHTQKGSFESLLAKYIPEIFVVSLRG
jgi:hypothetical protein